MLRRILYVQFTDPAGYPPIEHSSALLARRGWDVLLLGVGTEKKRAIQLPSAPRIRVKRIPFYHGGWRQKLQYVVFLLWTLWWSLRWRPRWIYASDPLSCPIVWWIWKLTGVSVIYHEHDSPGDASTHSRFMQFVLAFRQLVGRDAAICILPQEQRLQQFTLLTNRTRPSFCVWNCPSKEEIVIPSAVNDKPLILYYHGNISSDLLPPPLLIAVSRFEGRIRLRVAGYETKGNQGYLARLESMVPNASRLLDYLGILRRTELLQAASKATVGVCVMPKLTENFNLRNMVGASNKCFDYMACGLPLLVSDLPEWVNTFVNPGYARACDPNDANSIEVALRWYVDHPDERRAMGQKCCDQIKSAWNYEKMFADVAKVIDND